MKAAYASSAIAVALCLQGCVTSPPRIPDTAPVSEVIDRVKAEIAAFYTLPPILKQAAKKDAVCKDADGNSSVVIMPKSVKITLKTVRGKENAPSAGLIVPISVVKLDPSYSGSYAHSTTGTLELNLDVDAKKIAKQPEQPKIEHPIVEAVAGIGQALLDVDHTKYPCLLPKQVNASIAFDVVNKSTGGFSIDLWVFKVGDKVTISNESHQTFEIDFDLSKSGPALLGE